MTRFGAMVARIDERIPGVDLPLLSVSQTRGVLRRSELTDKPPRAESLDVYKVCRQGDIVFNKMSIRAGALGVAKEDGLVTYHYEVMRPSAHADARYLVYMVKSSWFISELILRERGIGAGDQANVRTTEVPYKVLRTVDAYLPPRKEQRAITDYLDRETAQVDALIGKQERLIETLRERRASTIQTHLLDLGGSETRLKHHADVQTGVTLSGDGAESDPEWPYLRVANVQVGYVDTTTVKRIRVPASVAQQSLLREGDVLMTEGGDIDKLGRGSYWSGEIQPCLHQNHVFAVRPRARLDARFLVYLLDGPVARRYFRLTARKTTNLASTNKWTLGNLPLRLPSVSEQRAAVTHLDEQTAKIDALIAKAERFIEVSKERRSALITAAVTGRIDVRDRVATEQAQVSA